jgi:hypothetical protein
MLGVIVGMAVLALGFFGWTLYRIGQYHHREGGVVAAYRTDFRNCVGSGAGVASCSQYIYSTCLRDPFWRTQQPFSFNLGIDPAAEAQAGCTAATTH